MTLSVTGCKDKLEPGHYEGNILKKETSGFAIEAVNFDVTYSSQEAKIEIRNQSRTVIGRALVSRPRNGELQLRLYGLHGGSYTLKRVPVKNQIEKYSCYADSGLIKVDLCFSKHQFHLRLVDQAQQPLLTLSGNQFKKEPPFFLEKPQEISLPKAVDEALNKNFESRMAVERVFQAKNSALAAWLNLIPHITANLIWHAPFPTYVSGIAVLQGLTPFLLPTYWMEAKNSDLSAKVQRDALTIVQADLASNLEQLFYAYDRDSKISIAHTKIMALLNAFELKVQQNNLASTPEPEIQSLVDLKRRLLEVVETTQDGIDRVLKEDQYAISLALGKHSPEAVSNISIGPELISIEEAQPIDQLTLADTASQRSFELQQLDYLIQIARIKKVELFFYWLDPSADQKTSLGFNLIGQERVAQSQIKELEIKREQLKSTIYHNAYLLALDFNEALENSRKIRRPADLDSKLQELSVKLGEAADTQKPDFDTFKSYIQATLADVVQFESNLAAFRVARAKKDRLLLSGYFEKLLPRSPSLGFPIHRSQIMANTTVP